MEWIECKRLIIQDLNRLTDVGAWKLVRYLVTNASSRITFWFRMGSYLAQKHNPIFKLFYFIAFIIHKHNQYLTGIQLPLGTQIGGGLKFQYFGCVVINKGAIIGENCTIFQGVTIGMLPFKSSPYPVIGDNVVLSTNVCVLGNVHIGDNSIVGAGSVVVRDIPKCSIAVGSPAKSISFEGKKHVDFYITHT